MMPSRLKPVPAQASISRPAPDRFVHIQPLQHRLSEPRDEPLLGHRELRKFDASVPVNAPFKGGGHVDEAHRVRVARGRGQGGRVGGELPLEGGRVGLGHAAARRGQGGGDGGVLEHGVMGGQGRVGRA
eukprot:scaffold20566_cov135-Isochrysis_galbana.AAC.2